MLYYYILLYIVYTYMYLWNIFKKLIAKAKTNIKIAV